jgi:23S rRNA (cytosine1962-C5)-methyltransferase
MKLPKLHLAGGRHKRLEAGHPWVFSNEIKSGGAPRDGDEDSEALEGGELVALRRADGKSLGVGLYHPHSLIAVRLLAGASLDVTLDQPFFVERLAAAQKRRERALAQGQAKPPAGYRVVHGEADGLPGVVVDRYGEVLVVQVACLGMEQRREVLYDALEEVFSPRAIVERNDSVWRRQEGLDERVGVVRGEAVSEVAMVEHGLHYGVDVLEGQKTGWFLDQRDHRMAIRPYAVGGRVLDLCCYQGGFTCNALAAGARSVRAVDVSERGLARVEANAAANHLERGLTIQKGDVMDLARGGPPGGDPFDLVVLDPPNFTRNRKGVPRARKAYRKLNEAALTWLAPGGVLATASCSHHIYEDTFVEILQSAAVRTGRAVRVVYRGFQPADHPVLLAMPETRYLKFYLLQLV